MKMHMFCMMFLSLTNMYGADAGSELARSKTQPHLQRQPTTLQKTSSIVVHVVQEHTIKRAQSATSSAQHTLSHKKDDRTISDSTMREVSSQPGSPTYSADSWVKVLRCPGEKACPRCFAGEVCDSSLRHGASFVQNEPFDTASTEFAS